MSVTHTILVAMTVIKSCHGTTPFDISGLETRSATRERHGSISGDSSTDSTVLVQINVVVVREVVPADTLSLSL